MLGGKCKILAVREKRPILPTQPNHQAAMNYRVGSQSLYGQMLNILICRRHSSSFDKVLTMSYHTEHFTIVVISHANPKWFRILFHFQKGTAKYPQFIFTKQLWPSLSSTCGNSSGSFPKVTWASVGCPGHASLPCKPLSATCPTLKWSQEKVLQGKHELKWSELGQFSTSNSKIIQNIRIVLLIDMFWHFAFLSFTGRR